MQTIVNRVTHQETSPREVSGRGINFPLARTFVCYRIPGNPSMTKAACQERQAQCYERDNERIRNPLSECRGCPGPSHAEDYIKSLPHEGSGEIGTSGGGGMVLGQCSICNTPAWTTGGYCMSCHGQVKIAESHGVGKEDALEMLHHYYAAGGKRPTRGGKNNSARTLIDWKGEKDVPQTAKEKKGTCAWCERPDKAFVRKFDGRSACGACSSALYKALAVGIPNEKLWEVCRPEIKEKNSRIVKGTSKPPVWDFLKKYTVASQEIPEPPHEKSTDIPTNHIADSGMADPVADSGKSIEEHQNLKYPVPQGGIVNSLQCLAPQAIIIDLDQEPEIKTLLEKLGKQQRRSSLSDVVLAILDGMVADASAREAAEGDS